ncbi:hypothetical protein AGABI2DRAFT_191916 [Agaricus bisporus var. bisporus H97]|uniref:hypothetical protein n=1 Tax=Agaricus bisporus var. bisporus (strain H97 / ATCC MYA-4626 / FGSC 10389) TaxID=936046 RepID=UPI00029F6704|nr:hypothetical protein AGABI2DRAFT_191916 [Agaricus bisporus var. bisporus H97]EKV48286.1 hypothetical protein AGABI2DRAFT_191916 [Agaricus bisporus var. bisporus H97]
MGIRNMIWSDWIELDDQYRNYQEIRARRIETQGHGVLRVLDDTPTCKGGRLAVIELVHELAEYLSRRYPTTFRVSRHPESNTEYNWGWEGLPPIKTITVVPLEETHELPLSLHEGDGVAEKAMIICALLIQDDLAVMVEGTDGRYYFQAGAICVPGFWRMRDKIGMPLDEIHISGDVPLYRSKLHASMERFFRRMPVEKPVARNNYFLQTIRPLEERKGREDAEELAWSESTNGLEREFQSGGRFSHKLKPTTETLRLRSERQTLRRLPISGAIVFTIRTYMTPIEELGRERGVPGRLASSMRSWPTEVGEYKGKERGEWYEAVLAYMDECHREQVDRGEAARPGQGDYPY